MRKKKYSKLAVMLLLVLSMLIPSLLPAVESTNYAEAATISISKTKLTLYVGKTYTLKMNNATQTVTWSSSKKTVATVTSGGKVTAKAAGTATITAMVNKKKYTCKVTVKEAASTTVYGKVTKISGTKITIALGTLNEKTAPSGVPAAPSGTPTAPSGTQTAPSGTPAALPTGTPAQPSGTPDKPSDASSDSQKGTPPSGGADLLTLTGKSITITISDTSILTKETMQKPSDNGSSSTTSGSSTTSSAELSDIAVGSILKVTYKTSTDNLESIIILGAGQGGKSTSTN